MKEKKNNNLIILKYFIVALIIQNIEKHSTLDIILFFRLFNKLPVSIAHILIEIFIIERYTEHELFKYTNKSYNIKFSKSTCPKILYNYRYLIAEYKKI